MNLIKQAQDNPELLSAEEIRKLANYASDVAAKDRENSRENWTYRIAGILIFLFISAIVASFTYSCNYIDEEELAEIERKSEMSNTEVCGAAADMQEVAEKLSKYCETVGNKSAGPKIER